MLFSDQSHYIVTNGLSVNNTNSHINFILSNSDTYSLAISILAEKIMFDYYTLCNLFATHSFILPAFSSTCLASSALWCLWNIQILILMKRHFKIIDEFQIQLLLTLWNILGFYLKMFGHPTITFLECVATLFLNANYCLD